MEMLFWAVSPYKERLLLQASEPGSYRLERSQWASEGTYAYKPRPVIVDASPHHALYFANATL
jgi:hypothetical protein